MKDEVRLLFCSRSGESISEAHDAQHHAWNPLTSEDFASSLQRLPREDPL